MAQKHLTMTLKQILSNDTERDEQFVKQIVQHCSSEMTNWLSDNRGKFHFYVMIRVSRDESNRMIPNVKKHEFYGFSIIRFVSFRNFECAI